MTPIDKAAAIQLQTSLNSLGFRPKLETHTGIFGPFSQSATMWFQTHWGIKPANGDPTPATLDAVAKALAGTLKPVTLGYLGTLFGAGGSFLDPIGGMTTINQKGGTLGLSIDQQPHDYTAYQDVVDRIRQFPPSVPAFAIG